MLGHCPRACPRASVCCCIAVLCSVDVHCGSAFCAVCSWLVQRIMGGEGLELRTDNCRGWVEIWPRWVSCCIVATLLSTLFYAHCTQTVMFWRKAKVYCEWRLVSPLCSFHFRLFPLLSLSLQLFFSLCHCNCAHACGGVVRFPKQLAFQVRRGPCLVVEMMLAVIDKRERWLEWAWGLDFLEPQPIVISLPT